MLILGAHWLKQVLQSFIIFILNVFQINLGQAQDFLKVLSLNRLIELDDFIRLSFSISLSKWYLWYFISFTLYPFHDIIIELIFGCSRREMRVVLPILIELFAFANEFVHMGLCLLLFQFLILLGWFLSWWFWFINFIRRFDLLLIN
jgi:hypothetical protein